MQRTALGGAHPESQAVSRIEPLHNDSALRLAQRVLELAGEGTTHLKLQKLCFYAYGTALSQDLEGSVGQLQFEAWKHGPVCRAIYDQFSEHGSKPLPLPLHTSPYTAGVEECLGDVLRVYGRLSAWQLRQQSHLEQPWVEAFGNSSAIGTASLKRFFQEKWREGGVQLPEALSQGWSLSFDGIPGLRYRSFKEMASSLS